MLYNLPDYDQAMFRHVIHLVPQWKMGDPVLYNYLQNVMTDPLAFVYADYHTTKSSGRNCLLAESSWPKKQAFCLGAMVMLLHNFHVDVGLMNGAIGIIRDIHYKDPLAMGKTESQFYVVVEFPQSTLYTPLIPGCPATYVPVPVMQARCDFSCCGCCTCMYIPLRVCIVLSIYKSQGLSIGGSYNVIKRVVVHLPKLNSRAAPGSALVAISRAINPDVLAFGNVYGSLATEEVTKIGTSPVYATHRAWLDKLRQKAQPTQERTTSKIAAIPRREHLRRGVIVCLIGTPVR
jgi:hypothetical protein